MICKNCGKELNDGLTACPACGAAVSSEEVLQPQAPAEGPAKNLGIASLVCSILAAYGHLFGLLPVLPLSIASIVTGILSNKKAKAAGQKKSGFATAGLITGSVVAGLHVLSTIFALLLVGLYFLLYFGALGAMIGLSGIGSSM